MNVPDETPDLESTTSEDEDETPDLSPVTTDDDETSESPDEDAFDVLAEAPGVAVVIDKETARLLLVLAFALLMAHIMYD